MNKYTARHVVCSMRWLITAKPDNSENRRCQGGVDEIFEVGCKGFGFKSGKYALAHASYEELVTFVIVSKVNSK